MKRICGAHARSTGKPCQASVVPGRTRYRGHGGLSTGPRTSEGKKRISDAQKRRWAAYRKKKADELWAVEWLAERLKPSRQRNLTPSLRKQMADQLRWWCDRTLDVELTG